MEFGSHHQAALGKIEFFYGLFHLPSYIRRLTESEHLPVKVKVNANLTFMSLGDSFQRICSQLWIMQRLRNLSSRQ